MKNNCQTKKLGEICDLQNGFAFKSNDYVNSSKTFSFRMSNIRPGGFVDIYYNQKFLPDDYVSKYSEYLLKDGDLVIAMTDMAAETKILGVPTIVETQGNKLLLNQRVGRFFNIKLDQICIPFLKYILSSEQVNDYYKTLGRGGLQINIGKFDILNVEIPLPLLPEQQRIVKVLDEVFEKIEKAKENAEKNLANSKELFESYLQSVFKNPRKDWQKKRLKDICFLITKGSSPKWQGVKYIECPGVLFITSENVGDGKLIMKNKKYVEDKFNKKDKKSILKKGDVLTNIVGASIGRTAIYMLDDVANINQAVCILRCNPESIDNKYLMNILNSPFLKEILHKNEVNTARANLSLGFFSNLEISLPLIAEQKEIVAKLDVRSEQTKKLEEIYAKKLADLEELKKSVLKSAFAGKF